MNHVYRLYRLLPMVCLSCVLAFPCDAAKNGPGIELFKNNGVLKPIPIRTLPFLGFSVKNELNPSKSSAFKKYDKNTIKIQKPKHKNKKKTRNVITKKRFLRIQGIRDNIKKLSTTNTSSESGQDYTKTLNAIKESLTSLTKDFNTLTIPEEKTIIKNILNGFKKPFDTACKTLNEKQNKKIADNVSNIVSYIFHQLQKLNTQVENDVALDKATVGNLKNALDTLAADTFIQGVANTLEDKKLQKDMVRSVEAIDKCKKLLTIIVEKEPKEQKTFWNGTFGKIVLIALVFSSLIGQIGQKTQEKPRLRCFLPTQCTDSLGEFSEPVCFNPNNQKPVGLQPQGPIQSEQTLLLPEPVQKPLSWDKKLHAMFIKPFIDGSNWENN